LKASIYKPIIAITMGDPAGVGPEICVGSMLTPEIHEYCRPFIIGSKEMLMRAAKILGKSPNYNIIQDPFGSKFEPGCIDVLETGQYDAQSIVFGKVQELAGKMSVDWIMKSIDLGMSGQVDGVATCPINKQAIKLAGVKQEGHTEIYRDGTHSEYALTMFSCRNLRAFMLSRHMSLMDACKYVNKQRVLEMLETVAKELKLVGVEDPLIAVAALNPHGSDNGLFGSEEKEHLIPAIEEARKRGMNVIGPIAADSIFHAGISGKFSAIMSLYHDQAHIACKTFDFERSITVTFGLPFIRTSVDHGTAFDIAGKGVANETSLIESVRIAAEYATLKHESKKKI
jgi:4-phospho-D-threonate 3-dehydrogenase / 4-phospho-D-erythronate 3-dehydrogenase